MGCLLPLCDMPNHRRGSPQVRNLQGGATLGFVTQDRIAKGEEVTITYGHYSLPAQLVNYGFAEEGAEPVLIGGLWDDLEGLPQADTLAGLKEKLFVHNGCSTVDTEVDVMATGGDTIADALLPCARVLVLNPAILEPIVSRMDDSDMDAMVKQIAIQMGRPLEPEPELDALLTIEGVLQHHLKQDEIWRAEVAPSLIGRATQPHMEALVAVRDLEAQKLRKLSSRIDKMALRLQSEADGDAGDLDEL